MRIGGIQYKHESNDQVTHYKDHTVHSILSNCFLANSPDCVKIPSEAPETVLTVTR